MFSGLFLRVSGIRFWGCGALSPPAFLLPAQPSPTGKIWRIQRDALEAAISQLMFFDARKPLFLRGLRAFYVFCPVFTGFQRVLQKSK